MKIRDVGILTGQNADLRMKYAIIGLTIFRYDTIGYANLTYWVKQKQQQQQQQ